MLRSSLILLPVALLATALSCGLRPAATKTLSGSVGPGFTISLKYKGKKVSKLTPAATGSGSATSPTSTISTSPGPV